MSIKKDWAVSNKETTYDPSLKGPTVVPGRDRASCRLTDARKVPNLIKGGRLFDRPAVPKGFIVIFLYLISAKYNLETGTIILTLDLIRL